MTTDEIELLFPAASRYAATARLTAASLAAEMDFPVEQIEELRVAVNELVAVLIEWCEDNDAARIEMSFRVMPEALEVVGSVVAADDDAPTMTIDALADRILTGVTDEHDFGDGRGRILKRRAAV